MSRLQRSRSVIRYGNRVSPVSSSTTVMALTVQFSPASRIFAAVSASGSATSDYRCSLRTNTLGAKVSHIAFPTQTSWSTDMRSLGAMSTSVISDKGKILNATIGGLEDRYPNILHPNSCPSPPLRLPP